MRLGELLKKWRIMNELGLRDMAKDLGVSTSTLSRIERGENMDGASLAKILKWLLESVK